MLELTSLEADSWHSVGMIIFFLVDDWLLELFAVVFPLNKLSGVKWASVTPGISGRERRGGGCCWVRGGGEMERADIPPQGD